MMRRGFACRRRVESPMTAHLLIKKVAPEPFGLSAERRKRVFEPRIRFNSIGRCVVVVVVQVGQRIGPLPGAGAEGHGPT